VTKISEEQVRCRKEAILAAAKRVFARKGCAQATMHDVAQEAGLSVGAIYLYYPGKDDLMRAVFENIGESTRGLFNKAAEGATTPGEILRATGRVLEERFQDPATRDETVLVLEAILADAREARSTGTGRESASGTGRQLRGAYLLLTEWLFGRAQETGALDPLIDTEALAQFFVSLMVGIHVLSLEFESGLDVKPVLKVVDEMLLRLGPRGGENGEEGGEEAAGALVASAKGDA
jgi:AcrR family transcriptional regulator